MSMQIMLDILQFLLYNTGTQEVMTDMPPKAAAGANTGEPELEESLAIDDCGHEFNVGYKIWPTFVSYGLHFHRFYEILIHRRNGDRFVVGKDVYPMVPYSFFVIAPHQLHDIISDEPLHDYERICIYVTESMLSFAGMNLVPMLEMMNGIRINRQNGFQLTAEEYDEIFRLSLAIHRQTELDPITPTEELEDRLHLMLILTILYRAMKRGNATTHEGNISPLILKIINYISDHYTANITLDSIAQSFNISKYYLSHEFSRAMGTSVYQYLLVCRINAAKQMILSNEPITSVAYRCGFNDYSSFLRAFDKVMGESPSVFKKRFTNVLPTL